MATFCLTGLSVAKDRSAVTIVQPADGPSLGVAPCNQQPHRAPDVTPFTQLQLYWAFQSPQTVTKR